MQPHGSQTNVKQKDEVQARFNSNDLIFAFAVGARAQRIPHGVTRRGVGTGLRTEIARGNAQRL